MKPENIEKINRSFELQAPNFESKSVNFTKEEYLNYTISCIAPCRENTLLEVAAGTCTCGCSFAPLVRTVVCLDATVPMLRIGQQEADKEHLSNMVFVKGYAEELPFLDNSFDIVFSRLAFHHFTDVTAVFSEMVRNLSKTEMLSLFETHGLAIEKCETTEIPQRLENWLALTRTPDLIREKIRQRMRADVTGNDKTGFSPYLKNNDIFFNQKWVLVLIIGKKQ